MQLLFALDRLPLRLQSWQIEAEGLPMVEQVANNDNMVSDVGFLI